MQTIGNTFSCSGKFGYKFMPINCMRKGQKKRWMMMRSWQSSMNGSFHLVTLLDSGKVLYSTQVSSRDF